MIQKEVASLAAAVADVPDGATVMIGGFGTAGLPNELVARPARAGREGPDHRQQQRRQRRHRPGRAARREAGAEDHLLVPAPGRQPSLRRASTAPARSSSSWCRRATWPSGSAPRAPASAASSPPPATAPSSPRARRRARSTAACTCSRRRSTATTPSSRPSVGDRWGNLTYRMTARNFGPVMAMAAKTTIATVHRDRRPRRARPGGGRDAGHLRAADRAGSTASRPAPAASGRQARPAQRAA